MRIVIDIQGAQGMSRRRGIGRYTRSFVKSFLEKSREHEVYLLVNAFFFEAAKELIELFEAYLPQQNFITFYAPQDVDELNYQNEWRVKASEMMREKLIEDLHVDYLLITSLFEGGLDNSVTSIGNYSTNIPTAVIFYDLIPLISSDKFLAEEPMRRWYERKLESLKRANLLLSISESAKQEAIEYIDFDPHKITNISSATDTSFDLSLVSEDIKEKYGITRAFLMHTSAYEERKNFEGLIEAFALLPEELRSNYQLVLVCKLKDDQRERLASLAKDYGLEDDAVILTGFVVDADLISLYTAATLFVFPSLHEGFGLPILEAMYCGTPAIGSNTTSIPEVIGREDALFDPTKPLRIAEKIEEVLTHKDLLESLREHGKSQYQKFSWDSVALRALQAIEESHTQKSTKSLNSQDIYRETSLLIDAIGAMDCEQIANEHDLQMAATAIAKNEQSIRRLLAYPEHSKRLQWRVEGPFDSSYSLALLNRESALALDQLGHDVALYSTEGPGDFDPDPSFLAANPKIAQLYKRSETIAQEDADVSSRNLYPPRVEDMHSKCNMLHHYAWEESGFPWEWVENFNQHLDGMSTLSTHVQKIMIDNGVDIPLSVSGCGVDHWERITPDSDYKVETKAFSFLHVSSCFPRKGVDILLKAYGKAFKSSDAVSLVIKTFANPHNEVHLWLEREQKANRDYPEVIIIEDDLSDAQLKALYMHSDVLVGPSRAEGFGLPFAEAMLSDLPVITTAWGGQLDFCSDETAWLVDYEFTKAQTHFELFDSVWAEPSPLHLAKQMRQLYALPKEQRIAKSQHARRLLLEKFKWRDVAERLVVTSLDIESSKKLREPKVGWITTWNTKCGIATYSQHLIEKMPRDVEILAAYTEQLTREDATNVTRCWETGDGAKLDALEATIEQLGLDTLVIQFNYSFFDFDNFGRFLQQQSEQGRTVIVMMHATIDAAIIPHKKLSMLLAPLREATRLLVHSHNDLNRLKSYGLVENVALFPHGILDFDGGQTTNNSSFTLASYGFFLPHKGLLELIEAVHILVSRGLDINFKMINAEYPVALSAELIAKARAKIEAFGLSQRVELVTEFLSDEKSLEYLSSSDLILFAYQDTGESASGAVRYGLASNRPVAVTPLKIFDDVKEIVSQLPGCTPTEIADGVAQLITEISDETEAIQQLQKGAKRWRELHRYSLLSKRLSNIIKASWIYNNDKSIW